MQAASRLLLLRYVNGIVRYFRVQGQEHCSSGRHNSPHDGKAVPFSVLRTRGSFYPPFIIRVGGVAVNFQCPPARLFRFAHRIRQRFSSRPRSEIGRKIARGRRERERGREEQHTGGFICTLMRSVTCGIDVPRKRMKRSVKAEPK